MSAKPNDERVVGQAKDVGFQIGVRKTFDVGPDGRLVPGPDGRGAHGGAGVGAGRFTGGRDRFSGCFGSGSGLPGVGLAGLDIGQAHLIGCSQGGEIALDFALAYPARANPP